MTDSADQGAGKKPSGGTPAGGGGDKPSGESLFPRPTMQVVTADRKPASTKTPRKGGPKKGS
jgi:hypothetical protein